MRINPETLMFEELTLDEFNALALYLEDLILRGKLPHAAIKLVEGRPVAAVIDEWLIALDTKAAGSPGRLLAISTVLPGYLGLSLLRFARMYGGIPLQKEGHVFSDSNRTCGRCEEKVDVVHWRDGEIAICEGCDPP